MACASHVYRGVKIKRNGCVGVESLEGSEVAAAPCYIGKIGVEF